MGNHHLVSEGSPSHPSTPSRKTRAWLILGEAGWGECMKRSQGLIEIPQHILSAILFFSFQHLPAIMFTTYMPPLVHNFDDSHMSCRLFTLIVFLLTFPFSMAKNKTFTFQSECLVIALSWGEINFGNICKVFVSLNQKPPGGRNAAKRTLGLLFFF